MLLYLRRFYNFNFSPDRNLVRHLTALLGYVPLKVSYYRLAFMHKSFSMDNQPHLHNERLEYLGDAVLGCTVAEYLFKKYPNKDEGFLTMMRSKMVNRKTLCELADHWEIDVFMKICGGDNNISESMLGNALEALIGAIYLDIGYEETKKFILKKIVKSYFDVHTLENVNTNYKSQLLEWCQKNHHTLEYQTLEQFKQSRRDKFRIAVMVGGKQVAIGEDFSKKSAEQSASHKALKKLGVLTDAVEETTS